MCKKIVEKYENASDEQLITKIRENDQDAFETLFYRYLPTIRYIISKNAYTGSEPDDMLQDATISFYYAVQMFDFHSASFPTFLTICVDRSLKSTIRKAAAKKRIPEELIVPIDDKKVQIKTYSAEEEFFHTTSSNDTSDFIESKLSALELNVLRSFVNSGSYDETAKELGLNKKSVDNAMARIRKKLNS
jgi:RNA polymerase sporulation-specific sigma factor